MFGILFQTRWPFPSPSQPSFPLPSPSVPPPTAPPAASPAPQNPGSRNKVIACIFVMAFATATAWCVSYSPTRMGVAAQFLDSSLVFEAGDVARSFFVSRLAEFQVNKTACYEPL